MHASFDRWRYLPATLLATIATGAALAQCSNSWLTAGFPGVSGVVRAMVRWDPDGSGPLSPRVVIGGQFALAGEVEAANLVMWDPVSGVWTPFGSGTNAAVESLLVLASGELVVGGRFTLADGVACSRLARWTGSTFAPLGSGLDGTGALTNAADIVQLPGGDLVVTGEFQLAGGTPAARIARWNGSSWSALGGGLSDPGTALAVLPNGELVAGGLFQGAGGQLVGYLARWNGSGWSSLGGGLNGVVVDLAVAANGDLIASGGFSLAGGSPAAGIASWNGSSWAQVGPGSIQPVNRVLALPGGDLLLAIGANLTGQIARIERWTSASQLTIGAGPTAWSLLPLPNNELLIGGSFGAVDSIPARNLARWDGTVWRPCNRGLGGAVESLARLPNGDLLVGGLLTDADGLPLPGIGRWNGSSWSLFAAVAPAGLSRVATMLMRRNGRLAVGGTFQSIGGLNAGYLAEWDGTTWSSFGSGPPGSVDCLAELPNGELLAGGFFVMFGQTYSVLRWDGNWWLPLGGLSGIVDDLVVRPNGNVIATGSFLASSGAPGNHIAEWNGSAWQPLGSGLGNSGRAMVLLPDGDLVVVGTFTTPGVRAARWNGSSWSALGSGLGGSTGAHVYSVVRLPNGDLLAGGDFATSGSATVRRLARWNGSTWSQFGAGADADVQDLLLLPDGVAFGGAFRRIDGRATSGFARTVTPCPASVATFGGGCAGAGGANVLAAEQAPWIGSTFSSRATGMPPNGLVASVLGLTAISLPLTQILPQGAAGCLLLASPDVLGLHVPTAGAVALALPVPNSISLAGRVWRQQVVAFELAAGGSIALLTSSNGLALTIGVW
jgi:trimeric autotransporter adhesin